MTQVTTNDPAQREWRVREWVGRVTSLVDQLEAWSRAAGWAVERAPREVREKPLGVYTAPMLVVHLPEGDLHVRPIARFVAGADGRVDVEGYPTLSRVKLLNVAGGWEIMTDSNVPLRAPWTQENFVQLARDLVR